MVINHQLEFFLDGICKLGREPNVGFQNVIQHFVGGVSFILQILKVHFMEVRNIHQKVIFLFKGSYFRIQMSNSVGIEGTHGHCHDGKPDCNELFWPSGC
jgi:hypothetical protein